MRQWHLYMVRNHRGALYTGLALNVADRLCAHAKGKGAKCLRGAKRLSLAHSLKAGDKRTAHQLEYAVKRLTKARKERIVAANPGLLELKRLVKWTAQRNTSP